LAAGWNPTATTSPDPLARFIGSTAHGPDSLREDFARFRFLLGVTDGAGLFAPDEP
jgi:hypothetical protein